MRIVNALLRLLSKRRQEPHEEEDEDGGDYYPPMPMLHMDQSEHDTDSESTSRTAAGMSELAAPYVNKGWELFEAGAYDRA